MKKYNIFTTGILATLLISNYAIGINGAHAPDPFWSWGTVRTTIEKGIKNGFEYGIGGLIIGPFQKICRGYLINPLIVNPLKKLFKLDTGDKIAYATREAEGLAKMIDFLKKAGGNRKRISELSIKLAQKINYILLLKDNK